MDVNSLLLYIFMYRIGGIIGDSGIFVKIVDRLARLCIRVCRRGSV